jgi:hypothetical protein
MTGQIAQYGAEATLNHLTGQGVPVVQNTAPTWVPGMVWVNDSTNPPILYSWNGTSWVSGLSGLYLALLIADPSTSGSGGGPAVLLSDLQEDTTAGYARQSVTFTAASAAVPSQAQNTAAITFGPYTANQAAPVQWAALVTAASGTTGILKYTWTLDTVEQVQVSQPIIFPAGALVLDQG